MTEQPGAEVERISVAPIIRAGAAESCDDCGHQLADFCPCLCHLPWDDTYYTKVGSHGQS